MPNRFEKYTRPHTPRRAPQSARNRRPNGRRRFGSPARPNRTTRQARSPCASPVAEGRPANASNPGCDASGRARSGCRVRTGARSTRSRNTVRSDHCSSQTGVGPAVRSRIPSGETAQPTRRDRRLAIQDGPGPPQAHVAIPIRSVRSNQRPWPVMRMRSIPFSGRHDLGPVRVSADLRVRIRKQVVPMTDHVHRGFANRLFGQSCRSCLHAPRSNVTVPMSRPNNPIACSATPDSNMDLPEPPGLTTSPQSARRSSALWLPNTPPALN